MGVERTWMQDMMKIMPLVLASVRSWEGNLTLWDALLLSHQDHACY
jgi:hypothetical protein